MKKLMMESALVVDVLPEKPNIFWGMVGATSVEKLADDLHVCGPTRAWEALPKDYNLL